MKRVVKQWALAAFRLSRCEYFADFFITPPITLALAIVSIRNSFSAWWLLLVAAGMLTWTLYEYALHRWVLHHAWFFRDMHDLHHARQKDYIAVHPALTVATYAAFWLVFGVRASAFMVGFSAGYVIYATLHTALHYARIDTASWLYAAKRRHALHHRVDDVNFGVSTSLWDRLFGTAL